MMMFDWKCQNGHVHEALARSETIVRPCPECGEQATRVISPVRCKLDSSFPGEADKWAKKHEQARREAQQKKF